MGNLYYWRVILLTLCFFFLLSEHTFCSDQDYDNIDDDYEHYLAGKYAPCYIFHPDEAFFFFDPGVYLKSTGAELNEIFAEDNQWGGLIPPPFDPNDTWEIQFWYPQLANPLQVRRPSDPREFPDSMAKYNANDIDLFDPVMAKYVHKFGWDFLRIVYPHIQNDNALHYHLNRDVPIFYMVERNYEGNIELQYWAFSHKDTKGWTLGFGDHMSDWLRIALVFACTKDEYGQYIALEPPVYTFYWAHDQVWKGGFNCPYHPRYLVWEDVRKWFGTAHPFVMVAKNDHEMYYQNRSFDWYPGVTYRNLCIPYYVEGYICGCCPFYAGDWEDIGFHYDEVGMGSWFLPSNLINLGNGDHPNPETAWMKFGGKWWSSPFGPLGRGGNVRFREHNIWTNVTGDEGSVWRTYLAFAMDGAGGWVWHCPQMWLAEKTNFVNAVLEPQQFWDTKDAFLHDCFGQSLFPYVVRVRFSVSTKNSGTHTPLSESNAITVRYRGWPSLTDVKEVDIWDGHDAEVLAFIGTPYTFSKRSSGSTEDHFWEIEGDTIGSLPVRCFTTMFVWHEVLCSVVEKVEMNFDVRTTPSGTLPGEITLKCKPTVQLPSYPYLQDYELAPNEITTLRLPVGASCWWAPKEMITDDYRERYANRDYEKYDAETISRPDTIEIEYYHQYKAEVQLVGASDYGLSVDVDQQVSFGDTLKRYNVYGRWVDWCDPGSELIFSPCLSFYPEICTDDPHSFHMGQPLDTSIDYTSESTVGFKTVQVTQNDLDEEHLRLSGNRLVWESHEGQFKHVWLYDYEADSLFLLSSATICGLCNHLNLAPEIDGDLVAWVTTGVGGGSDVIGYNHSTGQFLSLDFEFEGEKARYLEVDRRRIGWVDGLGSYAHIYDIDSAKVIWKWGVYTGYTLGPLFISGSNYVWRYLQLRPPDRKTYGICGYFPPNFGSREIEVTTFWEEADIDSTVLAVPAISGYDLAYVRGPLWLLDSATAILEYADMTVDTNIHGYNQYGKHYIVAAYFDSLLHQNAWSPAQVSDGYLSFRSPMDFAIHYIRLEHVRNACPEFEWPEYDVVTNTHRDCFSRLDDFWNSVRGREYHMSGDNFVVIDTGNGTDYVYFYQGGVKRSTRLSNDKYPKRSPRISGFNGAWLAHDGNDWEVFMGVGAASVETLYSENMTNDKTCHIDSMIGWGFLDGARVFLVNGKGQEQSFNLVTSKRSIGKFEGERNLVEANNVHVSTSERLSCDFDLAGLEPGEWGIVILNPDGQIGATENRCTVSPEPLSEKSQLSQPLDEATKQPLDITLQWTHAARADSYYVYFGEHSDSLAFVSAGDTTEYNPPGLVNLRTYYWRVDTKNYGGITVGDVSTFITICDLPQPVTYPTPENGTEEVPPEVVTFSWNAIDGADSFFVSLWTEENLDTSKWIAADTSTNVTNLWGLKRYYWSVAAINDAGSVESETWWFVTMPTSLPSAPSWGLPEDNDSNVVSGITFRWERCYQTEEYEVYFGLENPPPKECVSFEPEYESFMLLPDTIYYWQIVSVNSLGSAAGPIWSFSTPDTFFALLAPESLSITSVDTNSITVEWKFSFPYASYEVFRTASASADTLSFVTSTFDTLAIDSTVSLLSPPERTILFYGVKTKYHENTSPLSALVGKFDQELIKVSDSGTFNTISLPLCNPNITDASALISGVPASDSVCVWNLDQQCFAIYDPSDPASNFQIVPGVAYGTFQSCDATWTLTGSLFDEPQVLKTSARCDFNHFTVPLTVPDTLTSSGLCSTIPCCNSIAFWNPVKQGFVQYVPGLNFNNLPIRRGQSYFVSVTEDTIWSITGFKITPIYDAKFDKNLKLKTTSTNSFIETDRVNAPHLICGRGDGIVDSISASLLWASGITLNDHSAGSGVLNQQWFLQIGSPYYGWKEGDTVLVKIFTKERVNYFLFPLTWNVIDSIAIPTEYQEYQVPEHFALHQNYPNPFNIATVIRYDLKEQCHTQIRIYNILGQLVRTLVDKAQEPGYKSVRWDGKDDNRKEVASGIYLYRIKAEEFVQTKKMVLLR